MGKNYTELTKPGDLLYWRVHKNHVLSNNGKTVVTWLGIVTRVKDALVYVFAPELNKIIKVRRPEILAIEKSKDG